MTKTKLLIRSNITPIAIFFKLDFLYSFAAVDRISTSHRAT